jgi:hypothetical protein
MSSFSLGSTSYFLFLPNPGRWMMDATFWLAEVN